MGMGLTVTSGPIRAEALPGFLARVLSRGLSKEAQQRALLQGAAEILNDLKTYPPRRYGPQPFVSAKQRRGFFALLKSGKIQVPYKRGISPGSERLGQKWTAEIDTAAPGGKVIIGNSASYARLVQDRASQTRYHQTTGWKTVQDISSTVMARATKRIAAQILKGLVAAFRGKGS